MEFYIYGLRSNTCVLTCKHKFWPGEWGGFRVEYEWALNFVNIQQPFRKTKQILPFQLKFINNFSYFTNQRPSFPKTNISLTDTGMWRYWIKGMKLNERDKCYALQLAVAALDTLWWRLDLEACQSSDTSTCCGWAVMLSLVGFVRCVLTSAAFPLPLLCWGSVWSK